MSGGSSDKKQLGKIMLKQRLVTPNELDELLQEQKSHPGHRLASVAVESGKVKEVDLLKALSEQHGLPGIDLDQVVIPLDNLKLIPAEIAKRHSILPILVKEDRIFLAMADPSDRRVIDEIEFVTGRRVFPYVSLHDHLRTVIEAAYERREKGDEYLVGPDVPPDYLSSIGLAGAPDAPPPTHTPSRGTSRATVMSDPPSAETDDLGIGELTAARDARHAKGGELPGSFGSAAQPAPRRAERPEHPKILVVDDEDDIRKMLVRVLKQKGYEVSEASKGLEALQKVRDEVPDVILLDAMLPEIHGFDICRRIKGSKRYGHIPIIMVSAIYRGWRVAEDLRTSYGVDAFLEKPFKISDVMMHVERALDASAAPPEGEDEVLSAEASEFLDRGMTSYRNGDLDGAIAQLREGLAIDPLSFQIHYHLGLLCGRNDNVFEGIHELETAVDLHPKHFSALKNLAVLYQRAGFKHKAIEMWERALANAPDDETRHGIKDHLMSLL